MDGSQISFSFKGLEDLRIAHLVDVNPLAGAAVVNVPLRLSPGRSGFGPSLALQYSSSAGNSVYGFGWSLAGLPGIGLRSKKLPRYDGKDGFVFNGSEDLVPALQKEGATWQPRVEEQGEFWVHYYRSKVESTYTRFEKWVHRTTGRVHWRSRSPDNVVSIYGFDPSGASRIQDPDDDNRTFLWLLEAQYDSAGNAIIYEYIPEDAENLDFGQSFEWHRIARRGSFPQCYLKRILYGNTVPLGADLPLREDNRWLFEAVFDYGDHTDDPFPSPAPDRSWPLRPDPYSNCWPGFEVRTYRLCRRILMFHHLEELGGEPSLVGISELNHREDRAGTTMEAIRYTGYRRDLETGRVSQRSLPSLRFQYTSPSVERSFEAVPKQTKENFPCGLGDSRYRWVDLCGEGLPGILTETDHAWYYKPNLGHGRFGPQRKVAEKPSQRVGSYMLTDFDHDGNLNLAVLEGRQAGYCEYDRDRQEWSSFRPFTSAPHVDSLNARAQWLDINGDGLPDILISKQDCLTWYPSEGKEGFGSPVELARPRSSAQPQLIGESLALELFFADMTGDGMLDQVRIRNGRVEYWPQLGNGRFGDCVVMEGAPTFDYDAEFDPGRLRLVDLDGSGTADLLYIGRGEIRYWINANGNRFVEGSRLTDLPYIDNLSSVQVLDFLGDGTPCLVWSSPLTTFAAEPIHYLRLTSGVIPRLLVKVDNSMGQATELHYSTSSRHYLRDKETGRGWISKLPSHSTVVDEKVVKDLIGGSRLVSRYEYHDGYFDGKEREFRGFGLVDQYDAEIFANASVPENQYTPPACTRTWFHNGAFGWDAWRARDYYHGDTRHPLLPTPVFEEPEALGSEVFEQGYRALAGQIIRREVYAVSPNGQRAEHPYQVTQTAYRLRRLQPSLNDQDASFMFYAGESLDYNYEQQPDDPRVAHHFTLEVDPYGHALKTCAVAYPRRSGPEGTVNAQRRHYATVSQQEFIHFDDADRYELGIPTESKQFELGGLRPVRENLFQWGEIKTAIDPLLAAPLDFHETLDATGDRPQARLVSWNRGYYWNSESDFAARPRRSRTHCASPSLGERLL